MQNEVVKSDIHSTDTHGFSEAIFTATHMIDTAFAPRFKKIGDQRLYGFSSKSTYQKRGYSIVPSRTINRKLILKNWDDILRFMATIKLRYSIASQLFKRLSSYAKDHPLYRALKEFGRIIKSQFILTYYDDVELRQRIEKQLNKVELANQFSKAVFFANNQEFQVGTKEEQEIATACKVLIQNAIVLWNYLYLSQRLSTTPDLNDRQDMLKAITGGSIIAWSHVNMLFLHLLRIKKVEVEILRFLYTSVYYRFYCYYVSSTFFLNPSNRRSYYGSPNNYLSMYAK